jgi:hypothetical protein
LNEPTDSQIAEELSVLENILGALLGSKTHSEAFLIEQVNLYRPIAGPHLSDLDCENLVKRLVRRLSIDVELGTVIFADDFIPWLDERRGALQWERWITYKQWLLNTKRPWRVVDKLDELTHTILDFAGDPNLDGPWRRRGLVIGDVQSGKTSTYLGLLNKAVDAGYRLIIVLAGHTEVLRQQTQERIDEGLIGSDSRLRAGKPGSAPDAERYIGVGALRRDLATAFGMTTVMRDFRKSSQEATNIRIASDESRPYVFVVKKNKSVLEALSTWLSQQPQTAGQLDIPVLLIDDEADYASLNTNEETNPTAINLGIRNILARFSRSSYIGFTATPFANVFIDDENDQDLFPRDFIYSLDSPSNYVGANATFGTSEEANESKLHILDDAEDEFPIGHKPTLNVASLPESLRAAIRTFLITNAIRDLRNQDKPRSMLVNVSRFKKVQGQVFELVAEELSGLRSAIQLHSAEFAAGSSNVDLEAIRATYETGFGSTEFGWDEVLTALPNAVADIRVLLFNSDKDKKLADEEQVWDRPQRMIAVGGDVLSRGLTLDGLMTSYFYRNTQASDTLLQMARWFGYREGYEDLCRLWIDKEVADDFRFVNESIEQLRADLVLMHTQELTPEFFGIAVRKHPGALRITARNKMKSTEVRRKVISVVAQRLETTKLSADTDVIRSNFAALEVLVGELARHPVQDEITRRGYNVWRGVAKETVAKFLHMFEAHSSDELFFGPTLSGFVGRNVNPSFDTWDIVLVNGLSDEKRRSSIGNISFFPPARQIFKGSGGELRVSGNSSRLAGSDDLAGLLEASLAHSAVAMFREEHPGKSVPEDAYYPHLLRPALLVYALEPIPASDPKKDAALAPEQLLVAIKLAIPGRRLTALEGKTGDAEYVINTVAQRLWFADFATEGLEAEIDD